MRATHEYELRLHLYHGKMHDGFCTKLSATFAIFATATFLASFHRFSFFSTIIDGIDALSMVYIQSYMPS